mgnify:CR=1 FL=1
MPRFWIHFEIVSPVFSDSLEEIKDDFKVFCLSNWKDNLLSTEMKKVVVKVGLGRSRV